METKKESEKMEWNGEERRINRLHPDDITAIVHGVTNSLSNHYCRFSSIKTEEMEEVIPFMLAFKGVTEKTGLWIWKAIVLGVVSIISGLIYLGFSRIGK